MIDIPKTSSKRDDKTRVKTKKKTQNISKSSNSFTTQLTSTIGFEFEGAIEELIDDLKDQEKRFLDQQTIYELNRYKALIRKILKTVLEDGFRTKVIKKTRKNMADLTVKEIDARLAEISIAVTKQNKAFNFLKTIEEIRGLVFDLLY